MSDRTRLQRTAGWCKAESSGGRESPGSSARNSSAQYANRLPSDIGALSGRLSGGNESGTTEV